MKFVYLLQSSLIYYFFYFINCYIVLIMCFQFNKDCRLWRTGDFEFEAKLRGSMVYTISLSNCRCSCGVWQLSDMLCVHATSCVIHKGWSIKSLFIPYFHRTTYLQAYRHIIYDVPNHTTCPTANFDPLEPPIICRLARRPKVNRRNDPYERHGSNSRTLHCTIC